MGENENAEADEWRWERHRERSIKMLVWASVALIAFAVVIAHPVGVLLLIGVSPLVWIGWRIRRQLPPPGTFAGSTTRQYGRDETQTARMWAPRRARRAAAAELGEPWRSERWIVEKTTRGLDELALYLAAKARASE